MLHALQRRRRRASCAQSLSRRMHFLYFNTRGISWRLRSPLGDGAMATPAQRLRAMHLYRDSLKQMLSWAVRREVFYVEAEKIRAEFAANAALDDPNQVERALIRGEQRLVSLLHPDPYIVPYRPGGSMYARNPPFTQDIKIQLDFGREGSH